MRNFLSIGLIGLLFSQLSFATFVGKPVKTVNGGTQAATLAAHGVVIGNGTSAVNVTSAGTAGQVFTSNGASADPTFQAASSVSISYYTGFMATGDSWSTTSSTFADPTNSGGNTLTQRVTSGLTVTAAASNICGITFTPSSSTAVFLIKAGVQLDNLIGDTVILQMTDGSVTLGTAGISTGATGNGFHTHVGGVYAPATTSPVTLKLQLGAPAGGTARIRDNTGGSIPSVEWEIEQIKN